MHNIIIPATWTETILECEFHIQNKNDISLELSLWNWGERFINSEMKHEEECRALMHGVYTDS